MAVSLEIHDRVAQLTLDDGNKNVIHHGVLDELEQLWAEAEAGADAIVFSGRPGAFCAGYDIAVMTGDDPEASRELGRRGGRFALRLFQSRLPVVAVSPGHAFTIGVIWLACSDVRIGERGAFKYGMTEVRLGVPLGGWPLGPLLERLEARHTVPALLHSKIFTPDEACEAGLLDEVVDEGSARPRALEIAAELAQLPRDAYAATKLELRRDAIARMTAELGVGGTA